MPKRSGGWEADIRTTLEVSREVAKGCGSTAWVTALMNVCSFFVGLMNEQAQDDVWGANPDARVAGVFNPNAQTRKVDGGIIVTGAWNWASGSYHADWSFLGVQRIWRDSEIASRHAVVAPEISALIYGRSLMGFTEGVSFLV
ncbi:MAG: hypothetical protein ABI894_10385 [Ilumatobacteraceae bacterium]